MKNAKLILLTLTTLLFLGIESVSARDNNAQTVIIRVFEHHRNESKMITTSPDGSINVIKLTAVNALTFEGSENNSVIMQSEINKWKNLGFTLDNLSSLSNPTGAFITTIILSKKEE